MFEVIVRESGWPNLYEASFKNNMNGREVIFVTDTLQTVRKEAEEVAEAFEVIVQYVFREKVQ